MCRLRRVMTHNLGQCWISSPTGLEAYAVLYKKKQCKALTVVEHSQRQSPVLYIWSHTRGPRAQPVYIIVKSGCTNQELYSVHIKRFHSLHPVSTRRANQKTTATTTNWTKHSEDVDEGTTNHIQTVPSVQQAQRRQKA